MDSIERAADLLFMPAPGRGRTLDVKFSASAACGRRMSAAEIADMISHAERQVRSGKARLVHDVD